MVALLLLGLASSAVGLTRALEATPIINPRLFPSNYTATCQTIAKSVSGVYYLGRVLAQLGLGVYVNSNVEPKGHPLYQKGNSHWASSSNQKSACVVEPENAEDVSTILRIVGNTSTPFGIRSGGHATNPGFSSTPGVQIALFKLSEVTYHLGSTAADGSVGTVDIGSGLVWDDVYNALQPHGVTVVGGRVSGVGVGGFTLGGGYSWLSNQYGLTIDTVTAFEVVLPNGTITTATETVNPDLFFGLKGGFNNFGVVTKFTLLAFPQGQVWGGLRTFTFDQIPRINNATVDFINGPGVSLLMFYDGPTPPAGIFERFDSIPHFTSDVSTRSLVSLVKASPANATYGNRGAFNSVSLKTYSLSLIEQVANQSLYWGTRGNFHGATFISYDVEPFLPSMNARSKGGAYPHDDYLIPLNLYFAWQGELNDGFFIEALKQSTQVIFNQAVAEGQPNIAGEKQIKYGNYASGSESLGSIYGNNLARLKAIKSQLDPANVMSLAGGYRF